MGTLNYNLNVIDDFYEENDLGYMFTCSMLNPYTATYQPNENFFNNRANAYRCHETKKFTHTDKASLIFVDTFFKKTGKKIKEFKTFFRKIYAFEIQNVLKYKLPSHKDNIAFDVAGVVYFNTFGIEDGTGLFTTDQNQIEPDIIIGAKPNRCVFYNSQVLHSPLQSKDTEMRLIQPFFIKYE
jgi:hypothetical protein